MLLNNRLWNSIGNSDVEIGIPKPGFKPFGYTYILLGSDINTYHLSSNGKQNKEKLGNEICEILICFKIGCQRNLKEVLMV